MKIERLQILRKRILSIEYMCLCVFIEKPKERVASTPSNQTKNEKKGTQIESQSRESPRDRIHKSKGLTNNHTHAHTRVHTHRHTHTETHMSNHIDANWRT